MTHNHWFNGNQSKSWPPKRHRSNSFNSMKSEANKHRLTLIIKMIQIGLNTGANCLEARRCLKTARATTRASAT